MFSKKYKHVLDVAVIQWIMSCHKNRITTRVIILWHFVDNVRVNNAFLIEIMFILKAIHILEGHMINRILHSWSFYMKFMKLTEAHFINFI